MGRAAYFGFLETYQYPRVKKPSSARTRMTMRMIHRMLTAHLFPLEAFRIPATAAVKTRKSRLLGGSSAERGRDEKTDPASTVPSHP